MIQEIPDFAQFLMDLRDGEVNDKLTNDLAKVVRAVDETGKAGEVSLRFRVEREGRMMSVSVKASSKIPEHPISATLFHVGENGELLRDDPRQMHLRGLEKPALRTVSFPTSEAGDDDDEA